MKSETRLRNDKTIHSNMCWNLCKRVKFRSAYFLVKVQRSPAEALSEIEKALQDLKEAKEACLKALEVDKELKELN